LSNARFRSNVGIAFDKAIHFFVIVKEAQRPDGSSRAEHTAPINPAEHELSYR